MKSIKGLIFIVFFSNLPSVSYGIPCGELFGSNRNNAFSDFKIESLFKKAHSGTHDEKIEALQKIGMFEHNSLILDSVKPEVTDAYMLGICDRLIFFIEFSQSQQIQKIAAQALVEYSSKNSNHFKRGFFGEESLFLIENLIKNSDLSREIDQTLVNGIEKPTLH
ncbi:MAG: hypothetical protein CL678_16165 [Bdellovibrionaceae bacterium]|nr:hypothetical protein [Pseudobdellovibrionaceae bacterium]|tara:strand:+ start:3140 stop:3634 length:495 start_codon:yes stop_codon:yes gene_type:complete